MTYRQLISKLQKLDSEQLNYDVSIYDSYNEEYYPAQDFFVMHEDDEDSDVLEPGTPIIGF